MSFQQPVNDHINSDKHKTNKKNGGVKIHAVPEGYPGSPEEYRRVVDAGFSKLPNGHHYYALCGDDPSKAICLCGGKFKFFFPSQAGESLKSRIKQASGCHEKGKKHVRFVQDQLSS